MSFIRIGISSHRLVSWKRLHRFGSRIEFTRKIYSSTEKYLSNHKISWSFESVSSKLFSSSSPESGSSSTFWISSDENPLSFLSLNLSTFFWTFDLLQFLPAVLWEDRHGQQWKWRPFFTRSSNGQFAQAGKDQMGWECHWHTKSS